MWSPHAGPSSTNSATALPTFPGTLELSGGVNQAGLDFYETLIDALLELDIEPFVTLYHWVRARDIPLGPTARTQTQSPDPTCSKQTENLYNAPPGPALRARD